MRWFFILLAVIMVIIFGGAKNNSKASDQALLKQAQMSADNLSVKLTSNSKQNGRVVFTRSNEVLTQSRIQQNIQKHKNKQQRSYIYFWLDRFKNNATATAMGLDWQHHFVNSYLVGLRPFAVENQWLPLYILSKRKTYQLDSEQYGAADLWQNSAQAFQLLRGDCEDHALALADWLISEGVDAKVVIGKYKTGGHAWVVAEKNNQSYLLEATSKRSGKAWNHYPLASVSRHYYPQYMFNRKNFWVNTASHTTKDYQGSHWLKTSEFTRQN